MKTKEVLKTNDAEIQLISQRLTRTVISSIIIESNIEDAWNALTNYKKWGEWNTFIPSVEGDFKPQEKISIVVNTPGQKSSRFKPTVYEIKTQEKIAWGGKAVYVGFEGIHEFYLTRVDNQKIKFTQIERFRGPVVLFMNGMLERIARGYENMNNEFKDLLENNLNKA